MARMFLMFCFKARKNVPKEKKNLQIACTLIVFEFNINSMYYKWYNIINIIINGNGISIKTMNNVFNNTIFCINAI